MPGGEAGEGWGFFVSYTQADRAWAEWVAWQLEADGHRVLVQAWDMVAGSNWVHRMHEGVQRAQRTVVVLSPAYLDSVYGTAEWQAAWRGDPLGEQRRLLVVRVADCDRPGLLAAVVAVDLFGLSRTAAWHRLREAVSAASTGQAKPTREPPFPVGTRAVVGEPRFPGALPEVWNVPPRNPNFTGRAAELDRLHTRLAGHPAVTVQAVRGMGGVGKTQTAAEYAYRHAADYDLVWWVNAEQTSTIADQLTVLGAELGLPVLADPQASARAVRRVLRTRGRWLLVFDNAGSPHEIRPLLPGGPGHVLVTTRRGGFRAFGDVLDLDTLDRPDAVALLRRRAPALTAPEAEQVAARLGDLPLALDQAAAYLDQTGTPAGDYLRLLDTRSAEMYGRGQASDHPQTVATVWSVSFDTLRDIAPAAVQLLELCAWLAPEPIPLDLFTGHPDLLPDPLAAAAADPVAFTDTVGALVDYSLARRASGMILIHRLVQGVTRHRATEQPGTDQPPPAVAVVLALLRADLPGETWTARESWPRWRLLLPSVLAAVGDDDRSQPGEDIAWLLTHAGAYLISQGQAVEALPLNQRALRIEEASLGPDHPHVATDLNEVGWALSELGRAGEALPLHQRALRIREASLGPDHPDVAAALDHVGLTLAELGRGGEALPLSQRALRIREASLGPDHPHVAIALNQVGRALSELGRAAEALPLQQRALRIREASLGPDHPHVAIALNQVGRALSELGRGGEALPLHQRALRIEEASLGPDHLNLASTLNDMGRALSDLGRAAEALPLHQRGLRIEEASLGPDHPHVAATLDHVGRALAELGRGGEALPLHQRALRIREATFGLDHPLTVQSRTFTLPPGPLGAAGSTGASG